MVERLRLPAAWAAIEHFFQQPWSDGLPVVPPTEALVRQKLDTVDRRPEEAIGLVAPCFGEATVENLAGHAVLALPSGLFSGRPCRSKGGTWRRPVWKRCSSNCSWQTKAHNGWPASDDPLRRGGALMETYYHPHDLTKFADMGKGNRALRDKFIQYYSAVFADGALTEREKALIALGVAHAVQCPYCIDAYSQACLEKGSNAEEMTEAVHVACAIRGGAALVHGVQMRNVVEKLSM